LFVDFWLLLIFLVINSYALRCYKLLFIVFAVLQFITIHNYK